MKAGFQVLKRALALLSESERKKLGLLAVAVVGMSFMELFGVVSILPFMSVATNPETIHNNEYLSSLYNSFNFPSENYFLVALGVASIVALVVGNIFRALSSYMVLRFANMQSHYLGERILENYLYRPYEYFLSKNSSDLSNLILGEINQLINGVYVPILLAFGRACAAIMIVAMLIAVNFKVALVITMVLGFFYLFVYKVLRKTLHKLGTDRSLANQERYRVVSEAGGAIKEIKLMNTEDLYFKNFSIPSRIYAKAQALSAIIGELPKFVLETVAFGGMLGIVIYLIMTEGHENAISLAALYAFAGYKLMPALQQIFSALTQVRFSLPVLKLAEDSLTSLVKTSESESSGLTEKISKLNKDIRCENISYKYPGSELYVLQNVNLSIKAKTTVGILGPTGSGKTTLVDIMLGLLRPKAGKLIIDGKELAHSNLDSWQSLIGYVPQNIYLADSSVERNIAFGLPESEVSRNQVKKVARLAQIDDFIENQLHEGYETQVGERGVRFSGGQRQRIGIARALYHEPELIVFDEATSALDNDTEQAVIDAIEQFSGKKTIIMIAHRTSTLKSADIIFHVKEGMISVEKINKGFENNEELHVK